MGNPSHEIALGLFGAFSCFLRIYERLFVFKRLRDIANHDHSRRRSGWYVAQSLLSPLYRKCCSVTATQQKPLSPTITTRSLFRVRTFAELQDLVERPPDSLVRLPAGQPS